jgi:hypothetical protein
MTLIRDLIEDQHKSPSALSPSTRLRAGRAFARPNSQRMNADGRFALAATGSKRGRQKLSAIPYDGGSVTMIRRMAEDRLSV